MPVGVVESLVLLGVVLSTVLLKRKVLSLQVVERRLSEFYLLESFSVGILDIAEMLEYCFLHQLLLLVRRIAMYPLFFLGSWSFLYIKTRQINIVAKLLTFPGILDQIKINK